jgi:Cu/Ag efflux pump CusA
VFQVMVQGVPATRHSVPAVRGLLLDTPGGGHVRLDEVADVRLVANPVDIRHDAVSRYVDVRAGIAGRDPGAVRDEARRLIRERPMPLEYHAEVQGRPADERSANGFLTIALVAAAGIFLVLQAAFGSWRLAALLAVTLPVALVGGELVAFADGSTLGLGELAGLITVLGVAVRNGIGLLAGLQREQRRRGGGNGGPPIHVSGALEHAGPIALTAAAIAAAMLPFAVLGDVPGNEITHMTAVVVLGGLVTSTLTSLLVLPALFLHYGLRATAPARAPATVPTPLPQLEPHL